MSVVTNRGVRRCFALLVALSRAPSVASEGGDTANLFRDVRPSVTGNVKREAAGAFRLLPGGRVRR